MIASNGERALYPPTCSSKVHETLYLSGSPELPHSGKLSGPIHQKGSGGGRPSFLIDRRGPAVQALYPSLSLL